MSQNSQMTSWTRETVDKELENIMKHIFDQCNDTAKEYGHEGNLKLGANIAGFLKVADAVRAQGV